MVNHHGGKEYYPPTGVQEPQRILALFRIVMIEIPITTDLIDRCLSNHMAAAGEAVDIALEDGRLCLAEICAVIDKKRNETELFVRIHSCRCSRDVSRICKTRIVVEAHDIFSLSYSHP
jgi:hypothetical protein